MLTRILIFMLSAIEVVNGQMTGSCSDVLFNVVDKTRRQKYYIGSYTMEKIFCEGTYENYRDAQKFDSGASYFGISGHLGLSKDNWQEKSKEVCDILHGTGAVETQMAEDIQRINAGVIEAWSACMQSDAGGLNVYAEMIDENTFWVNARWRAASSGEPQYLSLTRSQLTLSSNLTCVPATFPDNKIGDLRSLKCTRNDPNASTVLLHTVNGRDGRGDRKITIPPVRTFLEPKIQPVEKCMSASGAVSVPVKKGQLVRVEANSSNCGDGIGWTSNVASCCRSGPEGVSGGSTPGAVAPDYTHQTLVFGFTKEAPTGYSDAFNRLKPPDGKTYRYGAIVSAPHDGFVVLMMNDSNSPQDNNGEIRYSVEVIPWSYAQQIEFASRTQEALRQKKAR